MLSFTKNRDRPQNRQVCLTTPFTHTWLDLLKSGKQITDITQATGLLDGTIWKRVRLACLSPKVQKAILNGTLNPEFTIRYLQSKRVPATWVEQDKLLISKVPC